MNLKTITAASMGAALAQVKRELGADAVILHTRTYRKRGLLGMPGPQVVEITAGDGTQLSDRRDKVRQRLTGLTRNGEPPSQLLLDRVYARQGQQGRSAPLPPQRIEPPQPVVVTPSNSPPPPPPPPQAQGDLHRELQQVSRMVRSMWAQQERVQVPPALAQTYADLLERDIPAELAGSILSRVQRELPEEAWENHERVQQAIVDAMAALLPTGSNDTPRVTALIGPTGVGKTTTIAKLAAHLKLRQSRRVALITLDTYRIAAVDQLRTYAQIIGVPLHVAQSPRQLIEVMHACRDADAVLIDTAGRSQRDDPRLHELRDLLDAAKPDAVHLVLSATANGRVMSETAQRFAVTRIDRLIFSKLDEAVSLGAVLDVACRLGKPISHVTTGQDVPRDIESLDAVRLARWIVTGAMAEAAMAEATT